MSHACRMFAFVLPLVCAGSALAQNDRHEHRRPPEGQRAPMRITAAQDEELRSLRNLIAPDEALWQSITQRYDAFRISQLEAMRTTRENLQDRSGEDTPPPREEMEHALAEALPPIRSKFIEELRALIPAAKLHDFEHWAVTAKFEPPRPRGRERASQTVAPLPPNSFGITVKDGFRNFKSNGVPNHEHGKFPGPGNPNAIAAQRYEFRVPEAPIAKDESSEVRGMLAGIALNGVVFDPGTAEFWKDDPSTGWRLEAIAPEGVSHRSLGIDASHAHVQPTGAYHYHGAPIGLIESIAKDRGTARGQAMILIGYAADGFPIYDGFGPTDPNDLGSPLKALRSSYMLKTQDRPGGDEGPGGKPDGIYTRDWEFIKDSGDLDECNGRFGVTPEYPNGTYHYVITDSFPYIHRRFKGVPDESFRKTDGPPPGRDAGRRRPQNAR